MQQHDKTRLITVIGTGDYGTSLGKRLLKFGFKVIYGSRRPDRSYVEDNFEDSIDVEIYSIREAWTRSSEIVFFAIHANKYDEVVKELFGTVKHDHHQHQVKTVVDVSNKIEKTQETSNAEFLQSCFNRYTDKVSVVKAFNTVSAYSMYTEHGKKGFDDINSYGNGQIVPIASDSSVAGETVANLANHIGFRGFTIGLLEKARRLERSNEATFIEWHYPSIFAFAFFLFNLFWYNLNAFLTIHKRDVKIFLDSFSLLKNLCSVTGITTILLLAIVYLAGLVATLYQLYNGTKRKRFPKYLDLWLKSRKQLGLWAFLFASAHLVIAQSILTPGYYPSWHKKVQPESIITRSLTLASNETVVTDVRLKELKFERLTTHGELNILTGLATYLLLSLLAITSINSIGFSLNWAEWNFIHTKCGYFCLVFALVHNITMYLMVVFDYSANKKTAFVVFTRAKFYDIWLPLFVVLLKLLFTFVSPLRQRIESIRKGVDYSQKILIEKL